MLGKTNITTLKEGGTVTEVEDLMWVQVQSGIRDDFKKAVVGNGILVGITEGGDVAYTADGEVWETKKLEYAGCKINDIEWDGEKFILVGSCTKTGETEGTVALAAATVDFGTFERLAESALEEYSRCEFIHWQNGRYISVLCSEPAGANMSVIFMYIDFEQNTITYAERISAYVTEYKISAAKCTNGALIEIGIQTTGTVGSARTNRYLYALRSDGITQPKKYSDLCENTAIECKDELYVMELSKEENYNLFKVSDANEIFNMCTGRNFGFISGVYFNGCRIFINRHEMLVVKKGESIADKTVEDLLEIAPELSMSCIVKAFGRLYVFGKQGVILKSSTETNNENVLVVQAISAKQALAEAQKYADGKYAELEARIAALETAQGGGV